MAGHFSDGANWRKAIFMSALREPVIAARFGAVPALRAAALLVCALATSASHAFVVSITAGTKSIFLQVGAGTMTGGGGLFAFGLGGTPGDNATINQVTVTVPVANLGAGTLAMSTDSTVTASANDGMIFCTVPSQVYVSGFFRTPGASANATLTATAPVALVNASGDTIPFNTVSWISGGIGDITATIPSGTFVGGASQTLLSVTRNTWFESCLQFNYANAQIVAAGSFTGRVTYTLTAP